MPLAPWLGMAATSLVAAMLLATNGFGFAVLAVPLFLVFAPADQAIPVAIILSLLISLTVLPGLYRRVEGQLLLRLTIGSLFGLPLGLAAFAYAEPRMVRAAAGGTIAVLAAAQALNRYCRRPPGLAMRPMGDVLVGANRRRRHRAYRDARSAGGDLSDHGRGPGADGSGDADGVLCAGVCRDPGGGCRP